MARYGVFSCSCTSFVHYENGWLFILPLLFQDTTNNPTTFGTFRGLILRSQLIILLKQKVSISRNFIVTYLSSALVQDTFTLTEPVFPLVYKFVPTNFLLGGNPAMNCDELTSHPGGSRNIPSSFILQ